MMASKNIPDSSPKLLCFLVRRWDKAFTFLSNSSSVKFSNKVYKKENKQ